MDQVAWHNACPKTNIQVLVTVAILVMKKACKTPKFMLVQLMELALTLKTVSVNSIVLLRAL